MRIAITLQREDGPRDVVVTAEPRTTVGEVALALQRSRSPGRRGAPVLDDPAPRADADGVLTLRALSPSDRPLPGRAPTDRPPLDPSAALASSGLRSGMTVALHRLTGPAAERVISHTDLRALFRVADGPDAGQEFLVAAQGRTIGRGIGNALRVTDQTVSQRHARLRLEPDGVRITDLNSANGLVMDGERTTEALVRPGDEIALGRTVLTLVSLTSEGGPVLLGEGTGGDLLVRSARVEARFPGEELEAPRVPRHQRSQPMPWLVMVAPLVMGVVLWLFTRSLLSVIFVSLSPLMVLGNYLSQRWQSRRAEQEATRRFDERLAAFDTRLDELAERERRVRLAETPAAAEIVDAACRRGALLWTRRPEHWGFLALRLGLGVLPPRTTVKAIGEQEDEIEDCVLRRDRVLERHRAIEGVPVAERLDIAGGLAVQHTGPAGLDCLNALLVQLAGLQSPAELLVAVLTENALVPRYDWLKWLPHTARCTQWLAVPALAASSAGGARLLAALEREVESRLAATRAAEAAAAGRLRPPIDEDDALEGVARTSGTSERAEAESMPAVALVVIGEPPVSTARLLRLAERGVAAGVHPVWVGRPDAPVPAVCRTFLRLPMTSAPVGTVGYVREGRTVEDVRVDTLPTADAIRFARTISGLEDALGEEDADADLPESVMLLDLIGEGFASSPDAVLDRWRQGGTLPSSGATPAPRSTGSGRLAAYVGQGPDGAVQLDLRAQGPHALIGGTTGSGKSEFLQTWVLAMAVEHSPARVTFLFVDYKGGSAFADCVRLPHGVGLVTDLNSHLVRRVLDSLRAELTRRERLFNRHGVKDLLSFEATSDPACPPALVIVVDEFAALVAEIPEFVDGMVDIAQRGRSLGIHLILATQRPAGVIRDNLRANTNLRIALRMADAADSTDVVGDPMAAGFSADTPGRAVGKTGAGRLVPFQSAYAGGHRTVSQAPSVRVEDLVFGAGGAWERLEVPVHVSAADERPDITRIVATVRSAAERVGLDAPRRPWLDELAGEISLERLLATPEAAERIATGAIPFGLGDDPAEQRQLPMGFDPERDGHLAVFGTAGSGKTTVLRTLVAALAQGEERDRVHVQALDLAAGGLASLSALPCVGSVIGGDDADRVSRLIGLIRAEIEQRAPRFAAVRAGGLAEYRRLSGERDLPRIVLLLDGMAAFRSEYEFQSHSKVFDGLLQILTDGRQVGVHVVLTADRPGALSPSVASAVPRRLVLRLADATDYASFELPQDVLGPDSPPGRCLFDRLETQVATLRGTASVVEQGIALDELGARLRAEGVAQAPAVRSLPERVALADVADAARPDLLPIGIADDTLAPAGIEPAGTFMISGPSGSGRTTALRTIARMAGRVGGFRTVLLSAWARTTLDAGEDAALWQTVLRGPDVVREALPELTTAATVPATADHRLCLVVEDISGFLGSGVDTSLTELLKTARRAGHLVVAEAETSDWGQSWPLIMELRRGRRGLALQPDQQDGDLLFRTSFPRVSRSGLPEGRGYLIERGRAREIQVARWARPRDGSAGAEATCAPG